MTPLRQCQEWRSGADETWRYAWRFALYSRQAGDEVRIFLSGKGVEIDQIEDPKFDVKAEAQKLLDAGAEFLAVDPA